MLIETIAETGLRFSEALGLTTAALDADAATLRVFRQLDKTTLTLDKTLKTNRSERTVPVSDELAQKLLDHLTAKGARFDQDALMFTTQNGAAIRQSNFNRREWNPLVEALGHDEISVHDLRRTFATHCADAGVPVHTLAAILGHSQATAQSYYIHAANETNRAGVERLRAHRAL